MDTSGLDAVATAEHVRAGRLTSVEAVSQALARIDALDDRLHAFVLVLRQRAMAAARQRDVELQAGRTRGPLHGVPVAIKDLFDIEGTRTGAGSLALPDHRAEATAQAVLRLEAAGAVVVGKVREGSDSFGFNAATEKYEDLVAAGVIDPAKVTRTALQNAASIAGLMLTTEAMIADVPDEKGGDMGMPGGGMGGMGMGM